MSDRRMVVLDLDCTTLRTDKTISERFCRYISHIQNDYNVLVTIATGRPWRACKPFYDQIGLTSKVVCANGGLIIAPKEHERIYFEVHHQASLITNIIYRMGLNAFANLMVEDGKDLYIGYKNDVMKSFCYTEGMNVIYGDHFRELKSPSGAIFVLKDPSRKQELSLLGNGADPHTGLRFWANSTVGEIYSNDASKASSMLELAREESIRPENIIAFGDADNDIEMIYKAGIGVAMKNGSPGAKRYADMVSLEDNDHEGVLETLKFLLPHPDNYKY